MPWICRRSAVERVVAGELRAQRGASHAARGLARPAVRPGPDRPRPSIDGPLRGRRPRTVAADLRPRLARSGPARGVRRVRPGTGRTHPGRRGDRTRARPGPVPSDGGRRPGDRLRWFRAAARRGAARARRRSGLGHLGLRRTACTLDPRRDPRDRHYGRGRGRPGRRQDRGAGRRMALAGCWSAHATRANRRPSSSTARPPVSPSDVSASWIRPARSTRSAWTPYAFRSMPVSTAGRPTSRHCSTRRPSYGAPTRSA